MNTTFLWLYRFWIGMASLTLSACVVLPHTRYSQHQEEYTKTALVSLKDDNTVFLVRNCYINQEDFGNSRCDERSMASLTLRPASWDLLKEVTSIHAEAGPYDAPDLRDSLMLKYGSMTFERPASGLHGTTAEFIGYIVGTGLVWFNPQHRSPAQSRNSSAYEVIRATESPAYSFAPRLVVRDGNDVWVFAERGGVCPDEVCFPVAETLGLSAADIPEYLRHKFTLYHATIGDDVELRRVLPARWNANARGRRRMPPSTGIPFSFDLGKVVPRSSTSTYLPDVQCVIKSSSSEKIFWLLLPPAPIGAWGNRVEKTHLDKCTIPKVGPNAATARNELVPAPDIVLPESAPPWARDPVPSSYECWPAPVKGQQQVGSGSHGCYFVLRDPLTGVPLPNTPYLVSLAKANTDRMRLAWKGITDSAGRTVFVRTDEPILFDRLQVIRRLVSEKDFSAPDASGKKTERARSAPLGIEEAIRLVCRPDTPGAVGALYRITTCSGTTFEGYTDPQGWTVAVEPALNKGCPATLHYIY